MNGTQYKHKQDLALLTRDELCQIMEQKAVAMIEHYRVRNHLALRSMAHCEGNDNDNNNNNNSNNKQATYQERSQFFFEIEHLRAVNAELTVLGQKCFHFNPTGIA